MKHELTHISPEAKIADDVQIDPFTSIGSNVVIGSGTWIGPNVTIMSGARIGKNCKIFPGAVVSSIPQDLKYQGEDTTVEIGDNSVIRECVTITKGTQDKYKTVIGANCLIMTHVHIAHDCQLGDNCITANAVQLGGHVSIGDFAVIGGTSAIHQFVRIGAHSMVSGGSLVRKDIPPFTKVGREPLSFCGINSVGLRRRGFDNKKINEVQEIYRILYQKGLNNSKALDYIELNVPPSKERDEVINFIRNSDRGILKNVALNSNGK